MKVPKRRLVMLCLVALLAPGSGSLRAQGEWEITPASEQALARGLAWLANNQGPRGNWDSNDLGLVALGALAFLADGHLPGRGRYGTHVEKALDYVLQNARPSGLLNRSGSKRDMYNHGLATFVLGQAHGMSSDPELGPILDRALKLIAATQCGDGGWDYEARRQKRGHDLSLAVMQAKALRGAMDSGLEVSSSVTDRAVRSVIDHYRPKSGRGNKTEAEQRREPGQFTYDGNRGTLAMAAAGMVCLQEYGRYDDWRIGKNLDVLHQAVLELGQQARNQTRRGNRRASRKVPFDAYTLYYLAQGIYQVGGRAWRECFPILRDELIHHQAPPGEGVANDGYWEAGKHLGGKPSRLFGTAVGCFVLSIPNRYLPILQEGKIESLGKR